MINIKVERFYIVAGPTAKLELVVDGLYEQSKHKKVQHTNSDSVYAILGALEKAFGYKAELERNVNFSKVPNQIQLVILDHGKKYEGTAQFTTHSEISDATLYAYIAALEQIVGNITLELKPMGIGEMIEAEKQTAN